MRSLIALIALLLAPSAWAVESAPITSPRATATLITNVDSYVPGQPLRVGLRLRIAPGWHSYWLNPGDAGVAPTLTVSGLTIGDLAFEVPTIEKEGTLTSYAYRGETVISANALPAAGTHGDLTLSADATWLVCANLCVPEQGHFTVVLPQGNAAPGAQAGIFAASDLRMPKKLPWQAHLDRYGKLWLEGSEKSLSRAEYFFPDTSGIIDHGAPQASVGIGGVMTLTLPYLKGTTPPTSMSGVLISTDLFGQSRVAYAVSTTPKDMPGGTFPPLLGNTSQQNILKSPTENQTGLLQAIIWGLIGGILLNLMPCVLPVLAMKTMALARLSGAGRDAVRHQAALYGAGVITAFALIGGFTIGISALGQQIGWGTQFQSLSFTACIAWLLFAIGLNLSGVFNIGAGLSGLGQNLAARGSFFTGLLAVIVATPCTAPFMGTAIAAALTAPPLAGFMIFISLGIGLAAPMLFLAAAPSLALRILPRPGPWMETLRQILAFPMYAAALWLVWVTAQQTGQQGLALVLSGALLVGFGAFALGRLQYAQAESGVGLAGWAIAFLASTGLTLVVLVKIVTANPAIVTSKDGKNAYSPERLSELRAAGKPVFIDAGAAWCVSCLVNEQVALDDESVREAFKARNITLLKADWTNSDPKVTSLLRSQGHDGVPLYLFYPIHGSPIILPQLLTPSLVLKVITATDG